MLTGTRLDFTQDNESTAGRKEEGKDLDGFVWALQQLMSCLPLQ